MATRPPSCPSCICPCSRAPTACCAAMNRGHTADDYRRLVERLRAVRPDLALSTDIIVGHPGETEADHEATLALIRDIGFAQAFSFKYSARPGTPAATMAGQVAEDVKDRAPGRDPGPAARPAGRLQPLARGHAGAGAGHRPGPPSGPDGRPHALAEPGAFRRPRRPCRAGGAGGDHRRASRIPSRAFCPRPCHDATRERSAA